VTLHWRFGRNGLWCNNCIMFYGCSMTATEKRDTKRQPNFTAEELEVLVNEVEGRSRILFGKFGGIVSMAAKQKGWVEVTRSVTAVSGVRRSVEEVKKKFCQLKSQTKMKATALKKERGGTGGGPKTEGDMSQHERRIIGVMGEVCVNGVVGGIDSCDELLRSVTGELLFFVICLSSHIHTQVGFTAFCYE
jgi:hypothetical protein